MSDIPADHHTRLDLADQIARIERNRAEIEKLFSRTRKFNRDPWFLLIGAIIAAVAARGPEILKAFGIG